MVKNFILSLLAVLSVLKAISQPGIPRFITPSPDATSLARYAEIPVSHYTGTPKIEIPIYDLQGKKTDLPVTLSYHASGNKVNDVSSSVGLGWSINAGGIITRVVRGRPDELVSRAALPASINLSNPDHDLILREIEKGCLDSQPDLFYFNFNGYTGRFYFDDQDQVRLIPHQNLQIETSFKTGSQNADSYFKITTPSGSLYEFFRQDKTLVPLDITNATPCNDTEFTYTSSWYVSTIKNYNDQTEFTLGYHSEKDEYPINRVESHYSNYAGDQYCINDEGYTSALGINVETTSSKLNRIVALDGTVIDLNYSFVREDLKNGTNKALSEIIIQNYRGEEVKRINIHYSYFNSGTSYLAKRLRLDSLQETTATGLKKPPYIFSYNEQKLPERYSNDQDHWGYYARVGGSRLVPEMRFNGELYAGADRSLQKTLVQAGILKSIEYPTGGTVNFIYEPHDYSRGYMTDPELENKVIQLHSGNKTVATDTFFLQYAQNVRVRINTERQLTFIDDPDLEYLGSYLYITDSTGVPRFFEYEDAEEGSKTYDRLHYLQKGKYFVYTSANGEPHDIVANVFYEERDTTITDFREYGGGIRISKIIYKDNVTGNPTMVRNYDYSQHVNGRRESTGTLLWRPRYSYEQDRYYVVVSGGGGSSGGAWYQCSSLVRFSNNMANLGANGGAPVAYEKVTETHLGGEEVNGKTEYKYSIAGDIIDYSYPFAPATLLSWKTGLLEGKKVYDDQGRLIYELQNDYKFLDQQGDPHHYTPTFIKTGFLSQGRKNLSVIFPGIDEEEITFNQYKMISEWFYLEKTFERQYHPPGSSHYFETIKHYKYDNPTHLEVTQLEEITSNGDTIIVKNVYPEDIMTPSPVVQAMIDKHLVNLPLRNTISRRGIGFNHDTYQVEKMYALAGGTIELDHVKDAPIGSNMDTTLIYHKYDNYGNPLSFTPRDGIRRSYIWEYQKTLPVAEVTLAREDQVAFTSFETDGETGGWNYTGAISPADFLTGKNAYILSSGNIHYNFSDSSPYTITFWAKGEDIVLKLAGNTISPISISADRNGWKLYTVHAHPTMNGEKFEILGTGLMDELRLFPRGAEMITYTYDPGAGITSINDSNNQIQVLEYDVFNRLKNSRDFDGNIISKYIYSFYK